MTPHARLALVVLLAILAVVVIAACAPPPACRPWADVKIKDGVAADPRWGPVGQLWVGARCRY